MKITSSTLDMTSSHVSQQHYELQESLRAWIGNRRPDFSESAKQTSPLPAVTTQLSDAGRAARRMKRQPFRTTLRPLKMIRSCA